LVTNPPYGQRLSSEVQLPAVYAELTRYLRELRTSSSDQDLSVSVISPDALLEKYLSKELKRSPFKRIKTMNGPIALDICTWKTREQTKAVSEKSDGEEREESAKKTRSNEDDSTAQPSGRQKLEPSPDLSDLDVSAFKNRLAKMAKHRRKWAKRNEVSCYRVYDADLPDFNVAIDLYQGACGSKNDGEKWIHIAEYRAPKNIDEDKAHARLAEVLRVVPKQFETPSKNVFLKQRQQERGGSQYQQKNSRQTSDTFLIEEAGLKFEVDLAPRLDTGIFLDHRIVRSLLREKAKDRDCLNLFAYTGTASVYMADGGARSVTTLDLSSTYLDWAQRNMSLNGFDRRSGLQLEFERADALRWVKEQRALRKPSYDLIFVDVPTFSNSSKMVKQSWDVQRDHVEFLIGVSRLLRHGGEAIFSANLRSFKPDLDALRTARVSLEDISKQTVPQDFERSPNIHHSFILRKEAPL
jgi:23S rRNA (guanine2445-N2)-methyltransferase / 23S rRNA (guanine2069-N7)-methyltransferase